MNQEIREENKMVYGRKIRHVHSLGAVCDSGVR